MSRSDITTKNVEQNKISLSIWFWKKMPFAGADICYTQSTEAKQIRLKHFNWIFVDELLVIDNN